MPWLKRSRIPVRRSITQWLTPAEFGAQFGVDGSELALVTSWLAAHGFTVEEISAGRRLIVFSGTAGEVASAFHTELHRYRVDGIEHIANASDPQIPAALAGVVGGVVTLSDFRRTSMIASQRSFASKSEYSVGPEYSAGSTHNIFPADFATIYDLNPLYSAGTNGLWRSHRHCRAQQHQPQRCRDLPFHRRPRGQHAFGDCRRQPIPDWLPAIRANPRSTWSGAARLRR